MLKVSSILVHVFLASHSLSEGFREFQGISGDGVVVALGGFVIVPSRYLVILFQVVINSMLLLQVGQFIPSNLSVSLNISGMFCSDEVMF